MEHRSSLSKYPLVILEILTFSLLEDVIFIRFLFPSFAHQWLILTLNQFRVPVTFGREDEGNIFFLYLRRMEGERPSHARTLTAQNIPKNVSPDHPPKCSNTQKLCNSCAVWKQSQFFLISYYRDRFEPQKDKRVNVHRDGGNRD